MRLPDFIIAGAPRTATTWLYHAAERHPKIAMAKPVTPEPKFFLVDDVYEQGLEYYSKQWFEELSSDAIVGEKSTNYLESETAARRIAADLPEVKLVFILRDPVERAYSNYLWTRQNGLEQESFKRALDIERDRETSYTDRWRFARPHSYFSRGLYAELLQPWVAYFRRDRMLFLRTEDIAASPAQTIVTFQRFLGVEERPEVVNGLRALNGANERDALQLDPAIRAELSQRYSAANRRLNEMLGEDFGYS